MSSSWYEDGQEVGMKLGMNMAKIFGRELSMAIDDAVSYTHLTLPTKRIV